VDTGQAFIDNSRDLLTRQLLPRIERSIERLNDGQLWWRPNAESNSIGNLMLHLAGNVRQWIVSGVGGEPDIRRRQEEFDQRGPLPRTEVLDRLRHAVADADAVLARLSQSELLETRHIQTLDVTVLYAVHHVVEHFSMHAGQIIYIAKLHAGDMRFYDLTGDKPTPKWN
jgi:uncharacterized damage-inducible protein DinB